MWRGLWTEPGGTNRKRKTCQRRGMIWERSREGAGMGSSRRDGRGHVGEQGKTRWAGVKLVLGVAHAGQESSDPVG